MAHSFPYLPSQGLLRELYAQHLPSLTYELSPDLVVVRQRPVVTFPDLPTVSSLY